MSVKSQFYKLSKEDFDAYLQDLKKASNTIHLFGDKFFFNQSLEITNQVIELNKKIIRLDSLIFSFTSFSRKQILQSFLIDEIQSTNKIENIYSTKHDILNIIDDASSSKDKKIMSIANAYKYLLERGGTHINSCSDIRDVYDAVIKESLDKENLPDGTYFRKGPVYITNGMEPIHMGIIGENNINDSMKEFIRFYNSNNELYIRMILSHFMFEHIHPYYDGNGRLGRFLFSNEVYLETKSYFAFAIALSFLHEKSKYYKAFDEANDIHEYGCLNSYVETILKILLKEVDLIIEELSSDKKKIESVTCNLKLTSSEEKIYGLLKEASIFSYFGVTNEEIMLETQVSKRTLMSFLAKFKEEGVLATTKIGKYDYHKLNS